MKVRRELTLGFFFLEGVFFVFRGVCFFMQGCVFALGGVFYFLGGFISTWLITEADYMEILESKDEFRSLIKMVQDNVKYALKVYFRFIKKE